MAETIATPSRTRAILERHGVQLKKGFGQNFLIDANIPRSIAAAAGITKEDCVLEIGPGIGSMTQVLAEAAAAVVAVEIDKGLIPVLQETLAAYDNVHLINQDILKTDIAALSETYNGGRPFQVVANLPYYITTPILMTLLEKKAPVASMTVMMQKEVAERLQARPGTADYGAVSLAVQYYCDVEMVLQVPAGCFMPRPKVDSAVIRLMPLPCPRVTVQNEDMLFHVIKCAFGQRRKTLVNGLFNQGNLGLTKEALAELLAELGLDARVRGEALSLQQFAALADAILNVQEETRK